jgi:hypothetical protein
MAIWEITRPEVLTIAKKLEEVGFFEQLGGSPPVWWKVPFLYRPALDLVQGSAE